MIIELRCELTLEAIALLTNGEEVAFDGARGKDQFTIVLRCTDAATASFREEIERALLSFLPAEKTHH